MFSVRLSPLQRDDRAQFFQKSPNGIDPVLLGRTGTDLTIEQAGTQLSQIKSIETMENDPLI